MLKRLRVPLVLSITALFVAIVVLTAVNVGVPADNAPRASDESAAAAPPLVTMPELARQVPQQCLDRAATAATLANDLAWSSDGSAIAVTSSQGERQTISILRAPTWSAQLVGDGGTARWAASGTRLAFSRGDAVVIVDAGTGRELARVSPAAPGFGWSGDTLLFWEGARLRGWRDGTIVNASAHAPDLSPISATRRVAFSADGSRYAIVSPSAVMYGETSDGRLSLLAHVREIAWSSFGANALVTYDDGQRAYLAANKRYFAAEGLPPVLGAWSPDGTQALLGSAPDGPSWSLLGWSGAKTADTTRIPSGGRLAAFSPDGTHLAVIFDDGLRLYRCGADASTLTLISRDRAKELIAQTGDLVRVNISDSKLIRWGDIAPMLTGDWAVREPAAAEIRPTDPVWLLMYAGEARRPAGVKIDTPTVSPILYVLDARDGQRLGVRIAVGTWWIGQPFESLVDRAPDPTAHPFEPNASNPIVMPTPRPTPTLATARSASGSVRLASAPGGWAVEYPDGWWSQRWGYAGATLSTRDPDFGYILGPNIPGAHEPATSVRVEIWANGEGLDVAAYVDRYFYEGWERTLSRSTTTVGGQPAVVLVRRQGPNPPDNSFVTNRVWIVPSAQRMIVIAAGPMDSPYDSAVERVVNSLTLSAPQTTSRPPDITRAQVLERWTTMKTPPTRVEAKLVRYGEASVGGRGNGLQRLDRDPDGLVWIVALAIPPGSADQFAPRHGPIGPGPGATLTPPRWQVYVTPAYTDDTGEMLWGTTSPNGDWPDFFDALIDRCC